MSRLTLAQQTYECLAQAPRQQLLQVLLPLLIEAASTETLQVLLLRAAAESPAKSLQPQGRMLECPIDLLSGCLGYLTVDDLCAVETVCMRWRCACLDKCAGWRSVLTSPMVRIDRRWLCLLARHRLSPATLTEARHLMLHQLPTPEVRAALSQLPALTALDLKHLRRNSLLAYDDDLDWLVWLAKLRHLQRLTFDSYSLDQSLVERMTPNRIVSLDDSSTLTELSLPVNLSNHIAPLNVTPLRSSRRFPALRRLRLVMFNCYHGYHIGLTRALGSGTVQPLTKLKQLDSLTILGVKFRFNNDAVAVLGQMTRLTSLQLGDYTRDKDNNNDSNQPFSLSEVDATTLHPLGQLSKLTRLALHLAHIPRVLDWSFLSSLAKLEEMMLTSTSKHNLLDAELNALISLPALHSLKLVSCHLKFGSEAAEQGWLNSLCEPPARRRIHLDQCRLSSVCANHLRILHTLPTLSSSPVDVLLESCEFEDK